MCVKVAYLRSKRITVLINTVAHGRNSTKFVRINIMDIKTIVFIRKLAAIITAYEKQN